MDPNANVKEQIELAKKLLDGDGDEDDAAQLADLVLALDDWLKKGGFPPDRWQARSRRPRRR